MTASDVYRRAAEKAYRTASAHMEAWRTSLLMPPAPSQVGAALVGLFTFEIAAEPQMFIDPRHPATLHTDPLRFAMTLHTSLSRAMTLGAAVEAVTFLREHDPAALAHLPDEGRDFEASADRAAESLAKDPMDPAVAASPGVAVPWANVAAIIRILHAVVARMQCEFLELPDAVRQFH